MGIWRYYFLILLLVPILFSISINDAFAEITISDDSTGGDCSTIGTWDASSRTCLLSGDLEEGIVIDSNIVTLDGNGYTITGDGTGSGVVLNLKSNVNIQNLNIINFDKGIEVIDSVDISILENSISNNIVGLNFYLSTTIQIMKNNISNNEFGVYSSQTNDLTFTENTISNNNRDGMDIRAYGTHSFHKNTFTNNAQVGLRISGGTYHQITENIFSGNDVGASNSGSNTLIKKNIFKDNTNSGLSTGNANQVIYNTFSNNKIGLNYGYGGPNYHNNFLNNEKQVQSSSVVVFYLDEFEGGNYWSDFSPICDDVDNDNFCDDPYPFSGGTVNVHDNFVWTIQDGWLTEIQTPGDITIEATDSTGSIVDFSVSATHDGSAISITCNPLSGSIFPIGTTEVICTASNGIKSTFSVTVNSPPPSIVVDVIRHESDDNISWTTIVDGTFFEKGTNVEINLERVNSIGFPELTLFTHGVVDAEGNFSIPLNLRWGLESGDFIVNVRGALSDHSFPIYLEFDQYPENFFNITPIPQDVQKGEQLDFSGKVSPLTNQRTVTAILFFDDVEVGFISGTVLSDGTFRLLKNWDDIVAEQNTFPFHPFPIPSEGGEVDLLLELGFLQRLHQNAIVVGPEPTPEPDPELIIPDWVRNNAGWWSEGLISNADFVSGVEFLIVQGILDADSSAIPNDFPSSLKENAGWWADRQISDDQFLEILENWIEGTLTEPEPEPTPEPEPEPEPVCGAGTVFDSATNSCILEEQPQPTPEPVCGAGTVFDSATNSCILEEQPQPTPEPEFEILSLRTTQNTYRVGDTIFITGKATLGDLKTHLTLQIFKDGRLVNTAELILRLDGTFTHTVLAEGSQWSESGKYLVRATYGGDVKETRFVFSAIEAPPEPLEPSPDHALVSAPSGSSVPGCEDTNECFIPFEARVSVGGTVTWSNDDTAAHTVTSGSSADGPDGIFDSSLFMSGGEFSHTFDAAGEFPYFCMVHPWMTGVVVVGQGGTSSTPPPRHEPVDLEVSVGQRIYDLGDLVTVGVTLEGTTKTHQVAIEVVDPTGTSVVTRTISVSPDSIERIQFRISDNFKTGSYKVVATTQVDGKTIKDTAHFKIISQFNQFRIVSVEVTDQQGHPSTLQIGDIGFIKVILDSNKQITTLITINLFDSDLTSIGIGSVKSTLTSGSSEIIISFLIPDFTALGDVEIFVNAFSDWPSNGGIPLTNEFSIIATLGNGNQPPPSNPPPSNPPPTNPPPQSTSISVNVSNNSFEEGETIVIFGKVSTIILETPVTIQIFNEGNLIEIAQLVVAQDGSFTHTILAQGPQWQNEGQYTVRASYGEGNITETNFEFFKQIAIADTSDFFEVNAGSSGTFDVEYIIRGGTVKDMIVDSEIFALIVIIESTGDGSITVDLPRAYIDATKSDGSDDLFIVLIDKIEVIYHEAITNENTRTITIQFEEGDSDIQIIGTFVI